MYAHFAKKTNCAISDDFIVLLDMLQIKTGEGKSVALGFCAVILSLLGFKVTYVCTLHAQPVIPSVEQQPKDSNQVDVVACI